MRASLTAAVLLLVLAVVSGSAYGNGPSLAGTMEARKIVLDKENREIAVPADKVYPSDRIEYTLRYTNVGDAPAAGVNLVGPVPAGTVYLENTATESDAARARYSIDGGKSFHEAPLYYTVVNEQGVEERHVATPDMYTHIMWDIASVLEVGKEISVSYRVQVK
jgi:uncharacterized repeat protein (TIGR01451 family)